MTEQPPPPASRAVRSALIEVLFGILCGLIALVAAVIVMRVSVADLSLRWESGGTDQVLHYEIFTSALDRFPFLPNTQLGFPTAQNLFFAPLFDPWSALFVEAIKSFAPSGIWALNVYNLAGFFGVGFTAYIFFRALRVRRVTSALFAVLFALVPQHFLQMQGHPFLANYWAVPLIGILVLVAAGGRADPLTAWVLAAQSPARRFWRRLVPILVLTLAVAFTQSYYYVFGAILIGGTWLVGVLVGLLRRQKFRTFVWPTVATGSLLLSIGVELAVLSLNFGDRYAKYFGARLPVESELFGGKLTSLLLPSEYSGFPWLAARAKAYDAVSPIATAQPENPSTAVIASLCMLLLFAVIVLRLFWKRSAVEPQGRLVRFLFDDRIGVLAGAFFGALLFFTLAGLGSLFAFIVTPEIRVWSRLSIVLSLLALGAGALFVETVITRRAVRALVLVGVVAVASVDQLGGITASLPIGAVDDSAVRALTASAEEALPDGCGVVQLPLKGFPETGNLGLAGDYDQALPYIVASKNSLRWSYGAVRGTHSGDYWAAVTTPAEFEAALRASGACAVLVDTYAYTDAVDAWRPFVEAVGDDPAAPLLTSPDADGRYRLYGVGGAATLEE